MNTQSIDFDWVDDGLSLVRTLFLEPLGIHINRMEGSLSEGFSLHGLHSWAIDAKTLTLDYNLTTILKGEHVVDSIKIDGLRIHLDDFTGGSGGSFPLPLFKLHIIHPHHPASFHVQYPHRLHND